MLDLIPCQRNLSVGIPTSLQQNVHHIFFLVVRTRILNAFFVLLNYLLHQRIELQESHPQPLPIPKQIDVLQGAVDLRKAQLSCTSHHVTHDLPYLPGLARVRQAPLAHRHPAEHVVRQCGQLGAHVAGLLLHGPPPQGLKEL